MKTTKRTPEPPPIAGRPPPHDLDAEAAVLASVLRKPEGLDDVAGLRGEHFFSEPNGIIFGAALGLQAEGRPVDPVTVGSWLRDRALLQAVGGAAYLHQLFTLTPAVGDHLSEYAQIVMRKARRRRAIAAAQLIVAEGYAELDADDEDAWLDGLPARLEQDDAARVEAVHIRESFTRVWAERGGASGHGRAKLGPPTGIADLDRRMGGFRPGRVTTVAARSGVGKTALAFQAATNVASLGDAVVVFELEAPEEECVDRLHYATAGVDGSRLLANERLPPEDMAALANAAERLTRCPLWTLPRSTVTVSEIRATARRLARHLDRAADAQIAAARRAGTAEADLPRPPRLKLVVVDYVQLVSAADMPGGRNVNREGQVSYVSRELKRLAMDLRIHVMVLSQLNKDGDRRGDDKRPRPSDMRESSAIENDSDHIILIYNPFALERSRGEREHEPFDDVELILPKNRSGKTGTVHVRWVPAHQSYRCIEQTERRSWST